MGTMTKLSKRLASLNFLPVLGTFEHPGLQVRGVVVEKGTPLTYDYNNGLYCVYDQVGCPWVLPGREIHDDQVGSLAREYGMRRGAYVPHSNDGGHWILSEFPELREKFARLLKEQSQG